MKIAMELTEEFENLANAIVKQAITDYKQALKRKDKFCIVRIEQFFRSNWCFELTGVSGDFIIRKVKDEVERKARKRK